MLQCLLGFLSLPTRKCSPYHAGGQFNHDKAKVFGDVKVADFKVISASIRHQRPSEELDLSDCPRSGKEPTQEPMSRFFHFLSSVQKEGFCISTRSVAHV